MRPRVNVYLPPVAADLLMRISVALGEPPSRVAAKIISSKIKEYAAKFGVGGPDGLEPKLLDVPDYLSYEAAKKYVKMNYGSSDS